MFSGDVDYVLVAADASVAYSRSLLRMDAVAVPGDGGHCEYGVVGVSRVLRPAGLSLLRERGKSFFYLSSCRSESRGCGDVGDRIAGFSDSGGCAYGSVF